MYFYGNTTIFHLPFRTHKQRTFNVEEGAVDEIVTFPPDVTKRVLIGQNYA